jgi:hypothetical protein
MGEFPLTDTEAAFEPRSHTPTTAPVDRRTFNYGRALGRPKASETDLLYGELAGPWNRKDAAAEYAVMEDYAKAMAAIANKLSAGAWAIDMALMHVRCSETLTEQAEKMQELRATFHKVDRDLEAIHVAPLRYHRYGRIGNVLRHFNPFGGK